MPVIHLEAETGAGSIRKWTVCATLRTYVLFIKLVLLGYLNLSCMMLIAADSSLQLKNQFLSSGLNNEYAVHIYIIQYCRWVYRQGSRAE